jgi:hypothetical protein
MELPYGQLSVPGPVRSTNEDFLSFWQPPDAEEHRSGGAVYFVFGVTPR